MSDSFWIEDTKIVVLTDSPIEATDIADMARANGHGPCLVLRRARTLLALLESEEFAPRVVVLSSALTTDQARACVVAAKAASASAILIDNVAHEALVDPALRLHRPFTLEQLQATCRRAGLRVV